MCAVDEALDGIRYTSHKRTHSVLHSVRLLWIRFTASPKLLVLSDRGNAGSAQPGAGHSLFCFCGLCTDLCASTETLDVEKNCPHCWLNGGSEYFY